MNTFIRIEIKRVKRSKGFWASLIIGLAISVSQYFMMVVPMLKYMDTYKKAGLSMILPHTVFSKWLGGEAVSVQHFLYFMILPILCTIPWSISLLKDKDEGITNNYFIRAKKTDYYSSKLVVNFFVGGIVITLPLLVNLALTAATLPSIVPEVATGFFAIRSNSMLADMFYTHPYCYVFIYMLIIFVFSGIISCFTTALSDVVDNPFVAILLPFITHLFCYSVFSSAGAQKLAPFYFLDPFQGAEAINIWIILLEALIISIITAILLVRGIKSEAL